MLFIVGVSLWIVGSSYSDVGCGKRGLLEKGSFQTNPFSIDSSESRDSRDSREHPNCGK